MSLPVSSRSQILRKTLLIALMALTLVGVQLVQVSPLHNHMQETVDCALCHLQLSDDVVLHHQFTVPFSTAAAPAVVAFPRFYLSAFPSPYQSRAPPRLFS